MVRDIVIRCVSGVYVLAVRFKSIKQDRRIERPASRIHALVHAITQNELCDRGSVTEGNVRGKAGVRLVPGPKGSWRVSLQKRN